MFVYPPIASAIHQLYQLLAGIGAADSCVLGFASACVATTGKDSYLEKLSGEIKEVCAHGPRVPVYSPFRLKYTQFTEPASSSCKHKRRGMALQPAGFENILYPVIR